MNIKVLVWQEDGVWCGSAPALPGCHTWGESYENLLEMLDDAIQSWLDVARRQGDVEQVFTNPEADNKALPDKGVSP